MCLDRHVFNGFKFLSSKGFEPLIYCLQIVHFNNQATGESYLPYCAIIILVCAC